ncbi:MAG: hypothetical protein ACR2J8_06675, partial [Thermomicrobiales bacterium]
MRDQRVQVYGDFESMAGLSRVAREMAMAMHRLGVTVRLTHRSSGAPLTDPETIASVRSLYGDAEARCAVGFDRYDEHAPFHEPFRVLFRMSDMDRVPATWIAAAAAADLVVVPGRSSFEAWRDSGIPEQRLRLCPLGVNRDQFEHAEPGAWMLEQVLGDRAFGSIRTRFLNVSDTSSAHRKNPAGLLAAWIAATTPDDDALLVLKWSSYLGDAAVESFVRQLIDGLERRIGKSLGEAAPIMLDTGKRADAQLPGLYAAFTHYISVSRGEGWDLPMMEAGAAGLRLIAPAHSAYLAYLNDHMATLLPAIRTRADVPEFPVYYQGLVAGSSWWEPDLQATATSIRAAIDGEDRYRRLPREAILREFSWENSASQLLRIMEAASAAGDDHQATATFSPGADERLNLHTLNLPDEVRALLERLRVYRSDSSKIRLGQANDGG